MVCKVSRNNIKTKITNDLDDFSLTSIILVYQLLCSLYYLTCSKLFKLSLPNIL